VTALFHFGSDLSLAFLTGFRKTKDSQSRAWENHKPSPAAVPQWKLSEEGFFNLASNWIKKFFG
jgi:hypothetical protein